MSKFVCFFFFFKQKTAYEIVSRDWSSDVCSSDLHLRRAGHLAGRLRRCRSGPSRSEEHTSELQSRETISYAVFCLKKKKRSGRGYVDYLNRRTSRSVAGKECW